MKTLITTLLLAFCCISYAQEIPLATFENFSSFKKSTTYFVKSDKPFNFFNTYMIEDLEKVWKITPYKVISSADFETLSKNKENSFIFISEIIKEEGKKFAHWDLLNITMGSKSGSKSMNTMPDLGSMPLCYVSEDDDDEDAYLYKLAGFLRFFQYYINYNLQNKLTDIKNMVKENKPKLASKELWLVQEDLAPEVNTIDKIKKHYSGKVKIVSKESIREAIHNANENVVFLHNIKPKDANGKWCLKILIAAADGCPIYYDITTVKDLNKKGFSIADFKKLN